MALDQLVMFSQYPIHTILPELTSRVRDHHVILTAAPGAGKSTIVPLALLQSGMFRDQKILMLEPRRLAVLNCAGRMAELLGEEPGQSVGYRIRHDSKVSAETRIEVVTEGILVRRLIAEKSLSGVGCVILDEFHERNIETDLAFAMLRELAMLDDNLRIVVMSATIDAATLLQSAVQEETWSVIESPGKAFPVQTQYLTLEKADPRKFVYGARLTDDFYKCCRAAVQQAISETDGDILVFLPGAGEIRKMSETLGSVSEEFLVLPLHSGIAQSEQKQVFRKTADGRRKIILATNIAETSITIDGLTAVVDSGFAKFSRYHKVTGLEKLTLDNIALDSAKQRAGRAGRTAAGNCYRLWLREDEKGMARITRPSLSVSNLTGPTLALYAWGADPRHALLPEPLDQTALAKAETLLKDMQALRLTGNKIELTEKGKRMAQLPVAPRLAAMLTEKGSWLACEICSLFEERDNFGQGTADIEYHLRRMSQLSGVTRERTRQSTDQLFRLIGKPTVQYAPEEILAAAYPDRIAKQRKDDPLRYILVNGRGARLMKDDPLVHHEWLVAAFCEGKDHEDTIRLAAALPQHKVLELCGGQIVNSHELYLEKETLRSARIQMLGAIEILRQSSDIFQVKPEEIEKFWFAHIRTSKEIPFAEYILKLQNKIRLLTEHNVIRGGAYPTYESGLLLQTLEDWAGGYAGGARNYSELSKVLSDVYAALAAPVQREINQLLPDEIVLDEGFKVAVNYAEKQPFFAARIQKLFNVKKTPQLAHGKIPLQVHLLSPAGRPVQITNDLASFWKNTYPEVRKELRGRYPKHKWPESIA